MTYQFIIAGIICFLFGLLWDLATDREKYLKNQTLNHTKEWWIRLLILSPSIFLFTYASFPSGWHILLMTAISGFMVGFWFWLLFDGFYNIWVLKREFLEVVGTTSKLDKIQQKLGARLSFIIKVSGIVLFTLIYAL